MASANPGLAVPLKILKRSSFTENPQSVRSNQSAVEAKAASVPELECTWSECGQGNTENRRETLRVRPRTQFSTIAHTFSAKLFRRRRPGRAETRQRLGAPLLGSGKLQTPPNRYQPARLLTLLSRVIPDGFDPVGDSAGKQPLRSRSKGGFPANSSTEHRTQIVYGPQRILSTKRVRGR